MKTRVVAVVASVTLSAWAMACESSSEPADRGDATNDVGASGSSSSGGASGSSSSGGASSSSSSGGASSDAGATPSDASADADGGDAADATLGTPCDGPGLQVITCRALSPRGLALSGDKIYWADFRGGTLYRANLDGSDLRLLPKPNDPSPDDGPLYIGVIGSKVYWTEPTTGRVRMLRDDGAVFQVATGENPTFLSTFGADVWWADTVEFGQVYRNDVPYGPNPGQQFHYPFGVLADADYFYSGDISRVAYAADGGQGRADGPGGTVGRTDGRFALDATHIYWVGWDIADGKTWLVKARKDMSGPPVRLLEVGYTNQAAVAVDATHVYVANEAQGTVRKVAKSGEPATAVLIAENQNKPYDIAVDATRVYWTNAGLPNELFSGAVMAAAKQ